MPEPIQVVETPSAIQRVLLGVVFIAQAIARRPSRAYATIVVRVQTAEGNEVVFTQTGDPEPIRSLSVARQALRHSEQRDQPGGDPNRN